MAKTMYLDLQIKGGDAKQHFLAITTDDMATATIKYIAKGLQVAGFVKKGGKVLWNQVSKAKFRATNNKAANAAKGWEVYSILPGAEAPEVITLNGVDVCYQIMADARSFVAYNKRRWKKALGF